MVKNLFNKYLSVPDTLLVALNLSMNKANSPIWQCETYILEKYSWFKYVTLQILSNYGNYGYRIKFECYKQNKNNVTKKL